MTISDSEIIAFSNAFTLTDADMLSTFSNERGWQNKYRRIMLTGKELPEFKSEWQNDDARVQGCESDVWLYAFWEGEGSPRLKLAASSNAKIVRGLVAIVLAAFNNKTREEIAAFSTDDYFEQLELLAHLSPSRGNGIKAIVDTIQSL